MILTPKMITKTLNTLILFLAFLLSFDSIASPTFDAAALIKKVDELYRADTSQAQLEMEIQTPHWSRTLLLDMWTRGMDETFITILKPKKDRGVSTLRKFKEMWNYFPKINKTIKVPPSMMMGSWMGSDFTNDDLVKESSLLEDYDAKLIEGNSDTDTHYVIQLTPKAQAASVWGKIVVEIRKKDLLPMKESYFDESGKKMRIMELKEVKTFGNRTIPSLLVMTPLNKENHKTVIRYIDARFNIPLKDDTFSLRNLKRKR